MDEAQKQQILEEYASNNMAKLRKISYPLFIKFGGISEQDHDDFYSKANEELWKATENFDETKGVPFEAYLVFCLNNKFETIMTRRNREKRKADRSSISINAPIGEDNSTVGDTLKSDFDIEKELSEDIGFTTSKNVQRYLDSLSPTEKQIADMVIQGYKLQEIKKIINVSEKRYLTLLKNMSSFNKQIIIKHKDKCFQSEEGNKMSDNNTQTLEKSKPDRWSVASIVKKIDNYTIRFDHPLQRESDQWSSVMKGNLISDILQDNPIPPLVFAEQVNNGLATIWNLDGKQRSTNVYSFKNDGYKIAKKIRRWDISYQAVLKDDSGKPLLDENGFRMSEQRSFDIRGKKFSDLPEELKDKFLDYNFEIVHYLNCKSEDIAYHLARYNEGKNMSASQKGIIRIGEEFATLVKSISAMPFFREKGAYTGAEYSNGTVDRVVIESVMASNFLNDWKKEQNDMCSFMKNNASEQMFEDFEEVVDKLSRVGTDKVFEMFNSKDSFLYFGLYSRFVNTGLDDEKFIEFIAEFSALHSKEINGVTFDDLNGKSTKDKNVVISKINHLEQLMNDYLHIETKTIDNIEEVSVFDFVKDTVKPDVTEEDIDDYYDMLNSYKVDKKSALLDWKNEPSLIAMIAYSFENDINLDDWIIEYFKNNNNYIADQKQNYLHMINNLEKYIHLMGKQVV